jgi:hypothetical protein
MTESYFFGDWRALERARVQRPHVLPADVDSDLLICGILMWSLIRFDLRSFDWLL